MIEKFAGYLEDPEHKRELPRASPPVLPDDPWWDGLDVACQTSRCLAEFTLMDKDFLTGDVYLTRYGKTANFWCRHCRMFSMVDKPMPEPLPNIEPEGEWRTLMQVPDPFDF